jgi:hypothetical protein
LVPGEGFEPPTFGLQNRCTAAVLTRQNQPRKAASSIVTLAAKVERRADRQTVELLSLPSDQLLQAAARDSAARRREASRHMALTRATERAILARPQGGTHEHF